jgi:hypothetical protein
MTKARNTYELPKPPKEPGTAGKNNNGGKAGKTKSEGVK